MAYNLTLDPVQSFSPSGENTPNVTDWSFNPASALNINHTIGTAAPATVTLETNIRDYVSMDFSDDNTYYVKHRVGTPTSNIHLPSIIELTGVINDAAGGDGYEVTTSNLDVDVFIGFINMQLVPVGAFTIPIIFDIYKKDVNGFITIHDFVGYHVNFSISEGDPFLISPSSITIAYVKNVGTSSPQNLNILAPGSFTIFVQSYITLAGDNLVDEGLDAAGLVRTYTGYGNQTATIDAHTSLNDKDAGYYDSIVWYNNSVVWKTFSIRSIVFDTDEAVITPSSLEFTAIKGFNEAEPQNLNIVSPYEFTILTPLWITATPSTGLYNTNASIAPILVDNLSEGVYEGNIIVIANSVSYTIPVTHTVYENVSLGMSEDRINFTEDFNTITNFYHLAIYKISLFLIVNYYKYNSNTSTLKQLDYKLALFNNTTNFFVGKTLNNIMSELEDLETIQLGSLENMLPTDASAFFRAYYKPAKVNLQVDFTTQNGSQIIGSFNYQDILFLKGRKPLRSFPNSAILNFYLEPLRVTPNSIALFNFYKTENHELLMYINGELHRTVDHVVGDNCVFAFRYKFSTQQPGDVVEIRLYRNSNEARNEAFYSNTDNYLSQVYVVMPAGKHSHHIAWETEHGVVEVMEFTGDISFEMGYENNTVTNYENYKEFLRKIDSRRSQNVTINTGFVLRQSPKQLDGLYNAKRAWILNDTDQPIALVPSGKSLPNYDSDQELYSYDVEFQINLDNDNKVNS